MNISYYFLTPKMKRENTFTCIYVLKVYLYFQVAGQGPQVLKDAFYSNLLKIAIVSLVKKPVWYRICMSSLMVKCLNLPWAWPSSIFHVRLQFFLTDHDCFVNELEPSQDHRQLFLFPDTFASKSLKVFLIEKGITK